VADAALGERLLALVRELHPLCRSLTGDGVRETLALLHRLVPLEVHEVPSGTRVFDWTVPDEWNVRDAFIADREGRRVVDFRRSNLHVVGYSEPVDRIVARDELLEHLHTLPEHPDWVPYRTSYYRRGWGFCASQRTVDAMRDDAYHVRIDARLAPGALSYGELFLPGRTPEEILVTTHVCHPSLCNDNLSGIAVAALLAAGLAGRPRRRGLRFLFIPGTLGSLTWLARNLERLGAVRGGLTLTCLGDGAPFTYKRSFAGDSETDRAAALALARSGRPHRIVDFTPWGYDERQFNAPGFRLPIGSLMRAQHGRFPEYHTSADDLDFVSAASLAESHAALGEVLGVLDANATWRSLCPHGEPQLGRRGLYRAVGGDGDPEALQMAMLWVLQLADGDHDLIRMAERSGLDFEVLARAAGMLQQHGLLAEEPTPKEGAS
jgi:aminopeptidase-like protein